MIVPLGQRAADDLANIISHSAERWSITNENEHPQFAREMLTKHQLIIKQAKPTLETSSSLLPYLYFLKNAINKHQDSKAQLKQSKDKLGVIWYWIDIPINKKIVRIGFQRDRIGVQPPLALMIVMLAGILLTLTTAVLLTRRLAIPVERLYHAAYDIGKGHWPAPIKEEGPNELKVLARTFNRMNKQLEELLTNRTTLLSGIAHDLRTPLTQIQLALEMLPDNGGDIELMESIQSDLGRINHLITESLSIATGLSEEESEEIDIAQELEIITHNHQQKNITINYKPQDNCLIKIQILALRRVINNLLENAIRYGQKKPIDISYQCQKNDLTIKIEDRGNGIPTEQLETVFRPFYRLEQSRGSGTGGSGLGLAIVQQLADSHGWNIKLKARQGGGTTALIMVNYHK